MIINKQKIGKIVEPLVYDALTSYPFIERDFDALTLYELITIIIDKLNRCIEIVDDIDSTLTEKITEQLNEWLEDGTIEELVSDLLNEVKEAEEENKKNISLVPREIKGNVMVNTWGRYSSLQGGCYIGNDRVVIYNNKVSGGGESASDTGELICYDIYSKQEIWRHSIKGYHGNTVSYYNNRVYITGCYKVADTATLINDIIVVNLDTPDTIETVLHPQVEGIYSACLDEEGNMYCITARGHVSGDANVVTVFDKDLNEVKTITLQDYPSVTAGHSSQGISCIAKGILWLVDYTGKMVVGFDAETGECVYKGNVEKFHNNYRFVGELQFITYDKTRDTFYLGSTHTNTGESGWRCGTIAEVGIFKNIYIYKKCPNGYNMISNSIDNASNITVCNFNRGVDPNQNEYTVSCMDDAVNLNNNLGITGRIAMRVLVDDFEGVNFRVDNYTGLIYGPSSNRIPINRLVVVNSHVQINNLDFSNTENSDYIIGDTTYNGVMFIWHSWVSMLNFTMSQETEAITMSNSNCFIRNIPMDTSVAWGTLDVFESCPGTHTAGFCGIVTTH